MKKINPKYKIPIPWEDVPKEWELIKQKKSKLPAIARALIAQYMVQRDPEFKQSKE